MGKRGHVKTRQATRARLGTEANKTVLERQRIMLTTLAGEIKGNTIVLDQDISAYNGNTVIVTILDDSIRRRKRNIDLDSYSQRTERGQRAAEYVRELRDNDRI